MRTALRDARGFSALLASIAIGCSGPSDTIKTNQPDAVAPPTGTDAGEADASAPDSGSIVVPSSDAGVNTLAQSMSAGQWAELLTNDINDTLSETGATAHSGVITGYSDKMVWDPVTEQGFFVGSDHCVLEQFVSYNATTNDWQRLPRGSWMPTPSDYCNGMGHGYEHSAINPDARLYFFHKVCEANVPIERYDIDTQTWTGIAAPLPYSSSTAGCYIAVEYFPELKGILLVDGGGAFLLPDGATTWKTLAAYGSLPMGGYQHFANYNPIKHVILFGGGDGGRQIYKLDTSMVITPLKDAPVDIGVDSTVLTCDPVGGEYLVFTSNSEFYGYDVAADTWTSKGSGSSVPIWNTSQYAESPIFGVVATPISNLGVSFFVTTDGPDAFRVFLYKDH